MLKRAGEEIAGTTKKASLDHQNNGSRIETNSSSQSIQFIPPDEDKMNIPCITLESTREASINLNEDSEREKLESVDSTTSQFPQHKIRAPDGPVGFTFIPTPETEPAPPQY